MMPDPAFKAPCNIVLKKLRNTEHSVPMWLGLTCKRLGTELADVGWLGCHAPWVA